MLNISFGEIFIIVVIGLIVIGPQRLPETARFVGHLLSRVQRQVSGIKSDIRREMALEDLKDIKQEYQDAAQATRKIFDEQAQTMRYGMQDNESDKVDSNESDKVDSPATDVANTPQTPPAEK